MKAFKTFMNEATIPKEIQDRNAKIDFDELVFNAIVKRFPAAKERRQEIQNDVTEYVKSRKVFSLGKIMDNSALPAGWIKAGIDAAKTAIDSAGFGRTGSNTGTSDRATRIDNYLKQKWISK